MYLQDKTAIRDRLVEKKSDFFRPDKSIKSKKSLLEAKKSIKKMLWLPNFKGRACNLDFPAVHESNFAAYFKGCQFLGPEKSFKVDF